MAYTAKTTTAAAESQRYSQYVKTKGLKCEQRFFWGGDLENKTEFVKVN